MTLKLYNSLTNKLEEFSPLDPNNVKIYACGPTVYDSPHIGNARPMIIVDVLFRLLKFLYKNVTYVRNITDVDDKINARAFDRGISIKELTDEVILDFHESIKELQILPVTEEPRATDHINDMLEIIDKLFEKGFAYTESGHVLFRVRKIKEYGMLSKRNLNEMIAGSRVEIAPYKEDPGDFVLWKPSKEGEPVWDSKYGKGRPGWHIECSAMTHKYLGDQFDIHAGGQDLMFPHHENEIAQNLGAFECLMARYWIHNAMISVDGKKMSKSLGNIVTLNNILKKYRGETLRYAILSAHYQKTLDFSETGLDKAQKSLDKLYKAFSLSENCLDKEPDANVIYALCNNLNTPLALKRLHEIAENILKTRELENINELCGKLKSSAKLLGLLNVSSKEWFKSNLQISKSEILKMIDERNEAKKQKNYALADEIRKKLFDKGIQIEDTRDGTHFRVIKKS